MRVIRRVLETLGTIVIGLAMYVAMHYALVRWNYIPGEGPICARGHATMSGASAFFSELIWIHRCA